MSCFLQGCTRTSLSNIVGQVSTSFLYDMLGKVSNFGSDGIVFVKLSLEQSAYTPNYMACALTIYDAHLNICMKQIDALILESELRWCQKIAREERRHAQGFGFPLLGMFWGFPNLPVYEALSKYPTFFCASFFWFLPVHPTTLGKFFPKTSSFWDLTPTRSCRGKATCAPHSRKGISFENGAWQEGQVSFAHWHVLDLSHWF